MVEKKTPAQEIRDLGNILAQINGLDNVETPEQQADNDTLVLASNPYGSSYADILAAKED